MQSDMCHTWTVTVRNYRRTRSLSVMSCAGLPVQREVIISNLPIIPVKSACVAKVFLQGSRRERRTCTVYLVGYEFTSSLALSVRHIGCIGSHYDNKRNDM
jgi:hypothetical protein